MTPPRTLQIPDYGTYTTVSYVFDTAGDVLGMAGARGLGRAVGDTDGLRENHYIALSEQPESFILVARWRDEAGVRFSAQGPRTFAPTLVAA